MSIEVYRIGTKFVIKCPLSCKGVGCSIFWYKSCHSEVWEIIWKFSYKFQTWGEAGRKGVI